MKSFVVGGGCFWCLDAVYRSLKGVHNVISGYSGGNIPTPSYEDVCTGSTGHAEVVKIVFDNKIIPEDIILDVFFTMHDPTQLNGQGNDIGTQYRSVMFYENEHQKKFMSEALLRARDMWPNEVVTEFSELINFYEAEDYHQDFFAKNPNQGYCLAVAVPKVNKVREKFRAYYK